MSLSGDGMRRLPDDGMPKDPIAAASHPAPYPYYAALRQRPVLRDESTGLWIATTAASVRAVLAHPAARVRPPREPVPEALVGTAAGAVYGQLVRTTDGTSQQATKAAIEAALTGWCDEARVRQSAEATRARYS